MKRGMNFRFFCGLLLSIFFEVTVFAQAGLTTGDKIQATQRSEAGKSFDYGNKSGNAIQQLEDMTGKKISNSNTDNQTYARSAANIKKTNNITANAALQNSIKMQLASGIANAFFSMIFSDNSQSNQKAIEEQREQAALLALRAAEEQRYNDSVSEVKYEDMMKSYKLLNDPNSIQFKTLPAGNTQFKSLDNGSDMTTEDRERQNLIKRGIGISWDFNSWTGISPVSNKINKEPASKEEDDLDGYLEDAFNKIETFEGGRIAALAGRFMLNIKKETMSYLKDASDAAVSGDVTKMEEAGQFNLRKLTSNAILNTGKGTANSYIGQGKDFITGELKDANFAVMKTGGLSLLQNYNIYGHVSDAWKVPIRQY